jgi:hypothetical protein
VNKHPDGALRARDAEDGHMISITELQSGLLAVNRAPNNAGSERPGRGLKNQYIPTEIELLPTDVVHVNYQGAGRKVVMVLVTIPAPARNSPVHALLTVRTNIRPFAGVNSRAAFPEFGRNQYGKLGGERQLPSAEHSLSPP